MLFSSDVQVAVRRASLAAAPGLARSAAMSEPDLQARAAGPPPRLVRTSIDINVRVTTGGAAAARRSFLRRLRLGPLRVGST